MYRRTMIGAASVAAGLAGVGTWAYRQAPGFWRQYVDEMSREIEPSAHRPDPKSWPDRGVYGAWLGHSTVLMKVDGFTIITDPVLSDRVGIDLGLVTLGLKRLRAPALAVEQIPKVDLILLSHAHFDHFDTPTLRALESRQTEVITAMQTSDLLRVNRYQRVRELGWDQSVQAGPVRIRGVEVNHWGARMRTDTYRGYNGYMLEFGQRRILFAGDTADTHVFRGLKSSKPVDLAIFPIGAYNPWIRYHCTPEQAWRMGNEAGVDRFLPVHHQTFQLSREPYLEPIERFCSAASTCLERVLVRDVGQSFSLA